MSREDAWRDLLHDRSSGYRGIERNSQPWFNHLPLSTAVAQLCCDTQGLVRTAEGPGLELLGLNRSKLPGASTSTLFGSRPEVLGVLSSTLAGREGRARFERNGRVWDLVGLPTRDSSGELDGVLLILWDQTQPCRVQHGARINDKLHHAIERAQTEFISGISLERLLETLLGDLLELTESRQGFVAEFSPHCETSAGGGLRVVARAELDTEGRSIPSARSPELLANNQWDDAEQGRRDDRRLESELDRLARQVVVRGEPVLCNQLQWDSRVQSTITHEPRSKSHPDWQGTINSFLGLPCHYGGEFVGVLGLVNCPGGYDPSLVPLLRSLLLTCGNLIQGHRHAQSLRKVENERDRFFTLSFDMLCVIGLDGYFRSVNSAFEALLGYSRGELLASPFLNFVHPDDLMAMSSEFQKLEEGGRIVDLATRHVCKNGSIRWLLWSSSSLVDDQVIYAIARDVTEQKRIEQSLVLADRRKDEFLAMLGHELRNPLAGIAHGLQLLSMTEVSPSVMLRAREVMEQQVRTLSRLVDDMLDVSRITEGKIRLATERVDLRSLVRDAVDAAQQVISQENHQVSMTYPACRLEVEGDRTRLEQVVANLLNNAVKYTEPGGRIWITLSQDAEAAVMSIRDSGIGIDSGLLPFVFELFTQAPQSLDRSRGGLGLGLPLVKKLVELHGGTVSAFSLGADKGSEFTVRLPLSTSAPASIGARRTTCEESPGRRLRILVLDDEPMGAELLVKILELWGHGAEAVHDATAAIEALRVSSFDLILCDIGLPLTDGYTVARQVRSLCGSRSPVMIAITGYGQEGDRRRSEQAGFADHLTKPVDVQRLESILRQLARSGNTAGFPPG